MKKEQKKLLSVPVLISVIVGILVAAFFLIHKNQTEIPTSLDKQLNFDVLLPEKKQNKFTSDKTSFKYDSKTKVLSFIARSQNNALTITEQSYPEVLIYDKLVGTLNEYAEIQTKPGKVALTKPKSLNGVQTAVLSTYNGTSGVLLFAKPQINMSDSEWYAFFNNLKLVQ